MNDLNKNIDDALLAKYLDGSTTAQQNAEVEYWIGLSEENKITFEQFQSIWAQSESLELHAQFSFDKEKAFKNVLNRIEQNTNEKSSPSKNKSIKFTSIFIRVAAVFILGISSYLIYQNYFSSNIEQLHTDADATKEFIKTNNSFISLPDQSSIHLNTGGEIKYAKNFTENRKVILTGEAFFDVKKLDGQTFIVETGDLQVKVLGTSFYITPLENDSIIEVGVVSGTVEVRENSSQRFVRLEENMTVQYNLNTNSFHQTEALDMNAIFWKSGVLVFDEKPLDQVLNTLAIHYNTQIDFQKDEFNNCKFTGRFQGASLSEILEQLQLNFKINVTKNASGKVSIFGKACD
jgi:ferric-dicitrate binding protein FerR (iron transport regulator)